MLNGVHLAHSESVQGPGWRVFAAVQVKVFGAKQMPALVLNFLPLFERGEYLVKNSNKDLVQVLKKEPIAMLLLVAAMTHDQLRVDG